MLQNLRQHAQGWVAVLIAGLLCVAFALWGIQYYLSSNHSQDVAAKVNGHEITQAQLEAAYKRVYNRVKLQSPAPFLVTPEQQKQLRALALNELVIQRVLFDTASKAGFLVTNAQLGRQIAQISALHVNGKFSSELLDRYIAVFFPSEADFYEDAKQKAVIDQVSSGMIDSNFILPNESQMMAGLAYQRRDMAYIVVPTEKFIDAQTVTEDQIRAYYQTHLQDFKSTEQVSVQYIELSPTVAQTKLGTDDKDKIAQFLADRSDELANLTYTNPNTLKIAAGQLGFPIQTTELFSRSGEKIGLAANPKVVNAAFSDSVLQQGNNSDLIPINEQTVVVLRVADHKPSVVRPLAEVRTEIVDQLKKAGAAQSAQQLGQKILTMAQNGSSLKKLAAKYHLTLKTQTAVPRSEKNIAPEILRLGFELAPTLSGKPALGGKPLTDGDFVVLAVHHIQTSSDVVLTPQQQAAQALAVGEFYYYLYIKEQVSQAKIKQM
ncbi:MAG: SurA N-terminal domain-containing protein [Gammaproteobacteria bacterium]